MTKISNFRKLSRFGAQSQKLQEYSAKIEIPAGTHHNWERFKTEIVTPSGVFFEMVALKVSLSDDWCCSSSVLFSADKNRIDETRVLAQVYQKRPGLHILEVATLSSYNGEFYPSFTVEAKLKLSSTAF